MAILQINRDWVRRLTEKHNWLHYFISWNDGFIHEEPKEEDYQFGASPLIKKVLVDNGQWDEYLPEEEIQKGRTETMACTCFALLNVIEILYKYKWDVLINKSDRYSAKQSGVTRSGNLMSRVLDSVRKNDGVVSQELYPNDIEKLTWNEFYNNVPQDIINEGIEWMDKYELGFESVYSHPNTLKAALKYSPLYVAGFAWSRDRNGYYQSWGRANHCFLIYGYEEGRYWKAFDSYPPYKKKLAWNYRIYYPKLITLGKKGEQFNIRAILDLMKRNDGKLKYIQLPESHGEVYEMSKEGLRHKTSQDINNEAIRRLESEGKLIGINKSDYSKLLT